MQKILYLKAFDFHKSGEEYLTFNEKKNCNFCFRFRV
jgi:hypothetical protein